jgi:hypothetical protein
MKNLVDFSIGNVSLCAPNTQIAILSQFRNAGRKCKGQKWTKEEKCFYLTLYKKGPRTYRFLNQIFILPSFRTVQRTLGDINIKAGIHNNIIPVNRDIKMAPPCKTYRKVYTWQVSSIRHIINIAEFATLGGLPLAPPYWRIGVENHISAIIHYPCEIRLSKLL